MCRGGPLGGEITELLFLTKITPIRQQNEPYLGKLGDRSTRKKIFRGTKKLQGRQKGYKVAPKKVSTFFLILFLDTQVFVGAPKNLLNGNVSPLLTSIDTWVI